MTSPGNLACRHVIHAVGPMWNKAKKAVTKAEKVNQLAITIINTLLKANELGCRSISMPAISSGFYGFPKPLCAEVFFKALKKFVSGLS